MLSESLAPGVLVPIGLSFCFIGAMLILLCRSSSSMMRYRNFYARNLEAQGELSRSERINKETERIQNQMPKCGRILIYIGLTLIILTVARTLIQK